MPAAGCLGPSGPTRATIAMVTQAQTPVLRLEPQARVLHLRRVRSLAVDGPVSASVRGAPLSLMLAYTRAAIMYNAGREQSSSSASYRHSLVVPEPHLPRQTAPAMQSQTPSSRHHRGKQDDDPAGVESPLSERASHSSCGGLLLTGPLQLLASTPQHFPELTSAHCPNDGAQGSQPSCKSGVRNLTTSIRESMPLASEPADHASPWRQICTASQEVCIDKHSPAQCHTKRFQQVRSQSATGNDPDKIDVDSLGDALGRVVPPEPQGSLYLSTSAVSVPALPGVLVSEGHITPGARLQSSCGGAQSSAWPVVGCSNTGSYGSAGMAAPSVNVHTPSEGTHAAPISYMSESPTQRISTAMQSAGGTSFAQRSCVQMEHPAPEACQDTECHQLATHAGKLIVSLV